MKEHKALFWILNKSRRRIPALLLMVGANAVRAVLGVLFALGSRGVIDAAVSGGKDAFLRACGVQFSIILGILICLTLTRYLTELLNVELDRDWKVLLLHRLLRGDYARVSAYHSGELLNRMNNDVRVLTEGLVSAIPGFVTMVVQLIAALIVMFSLAPRFALVVVALGALAVFLTGFVRKGLKNLNIRVSESDGRALSFLQEAMEKLLVVQAMDLTAEVERRTDVLLEDRFRLQRIRRRVTMAANTGISVLYYLVGFITLVWCAWGILQGRTTFGTLTAMLQLVSQLQTPFVNLSGFLPRYIAMTAAAERLRELEKIEEPKDPELEDAQGYYNNMDGFRAREMRFAYDEETVFENADFFLPKGSFAVITGASGIGKSTLLKLMLGVFRPTTGGVFAQSGEEETPLSRGTRGLFAYVPQGHFLFSGTLRENLLLSRPEATEEELAQAIHVSAMDQYLPQLPDGLETVIGENGAGLSEGQAQRLAIARAVLSGAPVLLLDEITSALDGATEELVLERIARLEDRTCIVVTHRPAALQLADWQLEVADKTVQAKPVEKMQN